MVAVKLNNNIVIDFQENVEILPEGFDVLWTEDEWQTYKEANRQIAVLLLNSIVNNFIILPFSLLPAELPEGFTELWTRTVWDNYVASRQVVQQKYTREQIEAMFISFQEKDFNANALAYLNRVDLRITNALKAQNVPESMWIDVSLPYAMIQAVEKYIFRIWARYRFYRLQLQNNQYVDEIDTSSVGEPPCWRGDVEWVLNLENNQADEPNRFVGRQEKLTIQYYKDYITQNS